MEKEIIIKNKKIGSGRPLICVPIMATTKEGIVESARSLEMSKTDMMEWRVDAFDDAFDMDRIQEVLEALESVVQESILVYTFRTGKQGGLKMVEEDVLKQIHLIGASAKCVDFVDVEFFGVENADERIAEIHNAGSYVIASHHNFTLTPSDEELKNLLYDMEASETDVVKLAVMPNSTEDVIRLMAATNEFHRVFPIRPLITMSMGSYGGITRLAGEYFGSCVTFGAGEVASAPGQFPKTELKDVLETIHTSLSK